MNDKDAIVTQLHNFLTRMCEWEKNAFTELEYVADITDEQFNTEQTTKRSRIFDEFVVNKPRRNGGPNDFSIGFPEKYNPDLEKILSTGVNAHQATVVAERTIAGSVTKKRKYTFIKANNNWLLDELHEWSTPDDAWISVGI